MAGGTLEIVKIRVNDHESSSMWINFLRGLKEHCNHSSFVTLQVSANRFDEPNDHGDAPEFAIHARHLDALLSFRNLTEVDLHHCGFFDLGDADLKAMAMAWPNIKTLSLRGNSEPLPFPRATLFGLISFAQYCPKLQWIILTVDATAIPALHPYPKVCNKSLNSIYVMHSPIIEPIRVAAFLLTIFPNISCIECISGHKRWEQVGELVQYFVASRRR
jgi:hypothetical protein